MTTLKIKTTGLSLLELREKYPQHFYKQSWFDNELFAKEKPPAGEYAFDFTSKLLKKSYVEQKSALSKDFELIHPATLAEAIIVHFESTGERLCEDWYSRTSYLDSDGYRVRVGFVGAGLRVDRSWGGSRRSNLGVAGARKLDTGNLVSIESSTLEPSDTLPLELKINGVMYRKV